jgi:hypothetical protein
MAKAKRETLQTGLDKPVQTLATALAEKGTGGLILLGLIALAGWLATLTFIGLMFWKFPEFKAPYVDGAWVGYMHAGFMVIGTLALALLSYGITGMAVQSIVGTIRAEAEAKSLTAAFGGRVATFDGGIALSRLPARQATRRIQEVLKALVDHAARTLRVSDKEVRANIFTTKDGTWLRIDERFHVNMNKPDELKLAILNGFYSTGTAFKYARPTLSSKSHGGWQYRPDEKKLAERGYDVSLMKTAEQEVKLAHPDLQWIISMPIPYQVNPFSLTCGVLNLDGLKKSLHRDQLKVLLADAATGAALVGVVNRTTDIFGSACERPDESVLQDDGVLTAEFDIPATEFDPAECPEPSAEFTQSFSHIKGLEFLKKLSPSDVALFLREQLRY